MWGEFCEHYSLNTEKQREMNKEELYKVIHLCNDYIDEFSDYINRLIANDEIDGKREEELRLKKCGMNNLRDMLLDKYNEL